MSERALDLHETVGDTLWRDLVRALLQRGANLRDARLVDRWLARQSLFKLREMAGGTRDIHARRLGGGRILRGGGSVPDALDSPPRTYRRRAIVVDAVDLAGHSSLSWILCCVYRPAFAKL